MLGTMKAVYEMMHPLIHEMNNGILSLNFAGRKSNQETLMNTLHHSHPRLLCEVNKPQFCLHDAPSCDSYDQVTKSSTINLVHNMDYELAGRDVNTT